MVKLISLTKTSQNLYGFINSRFWNLDWLKSSLQCRIFLDMLSVLVQRCGTNTLTKENIKSSTIWKT